MYRENMANWHDHHHQHKQPVDASGLLRSTEWRNLNSGADRDSLFSIRCVGSGGGHVPSSDRHYLAFSARYRTSCRGWIFGLAPGRLNCGLIGLRKHALPGILQKTEWRKQLLGHAS